MCMSGSRPFDARLSIAREADEGVRHSLLETYRNYLLLLARIQSDPLLRGRVGDSDIVQETLIQANRDFEAFRGANEAELVGWLRAIMSKKRALIARQHFGTAARDPRLEVQVQDDMDQSSQRLEQAFFACGPSPSQHADQRERAVLLADALAALPEDYREVVVLHHIKGYPLSEVAQAMGRSLDSVKKLWARAMIQLRTSLKGLA